MADLRRLELQVRARGMVATAVASGVLTRPRTCDRCPATVGEVCEIRGWPLAETWVPTRIEAHHQDYLRPLEVDWLCLRCHRRAERPRHPEIPWPPVQLRLSL